MSRHAHGSSLIIIIFFFFIPMVLSQLPSKQRNAMTGFFTYVNENDTNPCTWRRVNCTKNDSSIIGLSLSGLGLSSSVLINDICQIDSLQFLDLSNNHLSSIPNAFISDCGGINGLKMLNFSCNMLSGSLPTFHGFDGLQFLDLSYNKLTGNISLQLDSLVGIRSSNLSSNLFNGFVPTHFRGGIPEELMNSKQRNAMNGFFNSVNEKDPNPCSWKAVKCNSDNSSITHLFLSGLDLPSSDLINGLCQIDSLQSLDLSNNSLSSIPDVFIRDCGAIKGLKMLNFSWNKLSDSLPTFYGFDGLQLLDLSNNMLTGNISLQLDALVGVKSLNLSLNLLNGIVPTHFGKSMVLEELRLSNNRFSGGIPEELMNYRNLTVLDLSVNNLLGSVTNMIGELSKLETLLLSSNKLSGEIPESLSSIQTLSRLGANQNQFTGSVPRGISKYVRNLDLSYNELNGSIPSDFLSPLSLQTVDLSYNKLEGPIPVNISQNLIRLRLGNNFLNGIIPSVADKLPSNLIYLELGNNKLTGKIPWELGRCKSLALLDLAQNELTGLLPKELGNLTELQVMKLQINKLTGEIPDQFSQLGKLSILNISRNSLTGSIPSAISNLNKLMSLNLQDNGLNGSIPESIGSMNSLLELQLGNNKLSGKIPTMPPNLQISLNLSRNLFYGPIPDTLKGLDNLEVLDLSNNNFTGEIPEFLPRMGSLTLLLLTNNQLSGTLPQFRLPGIIIDTNGTQVLIPTPKTPSSPAALHKKKDSTVVAVVVAVSTAILAVVIVGMVFVLISRRFYRVNDETPQGEDRPSFPRVIDYRMITANSIHRSSIDFTRAMEEIRNPANLMLKNRFSTFYKAIMPCGASYYIKKLNWSDKIFQLGNHERFGEELEVLGKLSNSNIMTPLAYVLTEESAYLFYEYAQKGTLFNVLHGSLGHALDWASRYSIAIGVAQGLAFLHGCTTGPILLLDLSTRSILLKSLKEPQIGDIELFKVIDPSKITGNLSTVACSVGYMPPEYYTIRVTKAGNVYSFGVVLLELLTGKPAVSEGIELAEWVLSNSIQRDTWEKILDSRISNTSVGVRSQMLSVLEVALGCVGVSPEARPDMKSVLMMLLNAK